MCTFERHCLFGSRCLPSASLSNVLVKRLKPTSSRHIQALLAMKPPCVHPFYRRNALIVAMLSFVANGTLATLVLFRTSPELRKYSRVLLCSCTVEIVFAATCLLVDAVSAEVGRFVTITAVAAACASATMSVARCDLHFLR